MVIDYILHSEIRLKKMGYFMQDWVKEHVKVVIHET